MASLTEFRALFPQFASDTTFPDATVEQWFTQFALRFTGSKFGSQATFALYCFTGHWLIATGVGLSDQTEVHIQRGPVKSEKVDDLTRAYVATVDLDRIPAGLHVYSTTMYGQCLISIIQSRRAGAPRVVRTGSSSTSVGSTRNGS